MMRLDTQPKIFSNVYLNVNYKVSYCFKADSMITDVKVKSVKKRNLLRIFF